MADQMSGAGALGTSRDNSPPRLLDRVRQAIRLRHYSQRTEQAYVGWIRRFIVFHGKRHPAVLFLFETVLGQQLAWMHEIVRAQRPVRLPVVLSRDEVASLLSRLKGPVWLMASLMYGAGLRLLECAELRVKDINFDRGELTIWAGKGGKDRVTMRPAAIRRALLDHAEHVKAQHEADLAAGRGSVALPGALRSKYPNAAGDMTSGPSRNCSGIAT